MTSIAFLRNWAYNNDLLVNEVGAEHLLVRHLKSRPDQTEPWDGMRNHQARNCMRDDMKVGDLILFYHSNMIPPIVAGIAQVSSEPNPDPKAFDKSLSIMLQKVILTTHTGYSLM